MSENCAEIWKTIPGFDPEYQASSHGRMRSLKWGRERILKQGKTTNNHGYLLVSITRPNGARTSTTLQRAIFLAFHGAIPEGMEIDHIDHNPENNRPENLRAVTRQENMAKSWEKRRAAGHTAMHTVGNHCKRGHEFTPENTRMKNDGYRYCRACERTRYERNRQRIA